MDGAVILDFSHYRNGTYVKADPVYRWDAGRHIVAKGISTEILSAEVHYAISGAIVADDYICQILGDTITCDIPNELLQQSYPIFVYIYVTQEGLTITKYQARIPIIDRAKPATTLGDVNSEAYSAINLIKSYLYGNTGIRYGEQTDNVVYYYTQTKNNTQVIRDNLPAINTVSDNIQNVNAVSENIDKVNTVSDNIQDVVKVADDVQNIDIVADNIEDINNAKKNAQYAEYHANQANKSAMAAAKSASESKGYSEDSKESAEQANKYLTDVKQYAGIIIPVLVLDDETGMLYESPDGNHCEFYLDPDTQMLYYMYTSEDTSKDPLRMYGTEITKDQIDRLWTEDGEEG